MGSVASAELIRGLYDYHWWANRRLFDVAAGLGEEVAAREVGKQFSFLTLRRMLAHIYETDWAWLQRWIGASPSPTKLPGDEIPSLGVLRERWDALEREQRAFIQGLTVADLARVVTYRNTAGREFRLALWPLVQHVANHATHHRSELATMLTVSSGSPPPTDLVVYHLLRTGQMAP
ncbi:MAG: hypothetical protein DME06_06570 [Candidatus Rokuibacteriota bacterium]|nr:MAG: hypothetical protein DME09_13860 [Candidatus Rokubacteria bacterium]PYN13609.1 MAG: hypothetical protein DME06_06570 [Candidatus Rokubacteria bacterium]